MNIEAMDSSTNDTSSRITSVTRPMSITIRKVSSAFKKEKKLGFKGQISQDAKKLHSEVGKFQTQYDVLRKKEKDTRREEKEHMIEELEFLIQEADKTNEIYTGILAECCNDLNTGSFMLQALEPVNSKTRNKTKSFMGYGDRRSSTSLGDGSTSRSNGDRRRVNLKKQAKPKKLGLLKGLKKKERTEGGINQMSSTSRASTRSRFSKSFLGDKTDEEKFEQINIYPLENYLKSLKVVVGNLKNLLENINRCSEDKEIKIRLNGSVSGVYNPLSGQVEWKEMDRGGVCGVFNPRTMEVEWKSRKGFGVHGVYNELSRKVEWRYCRNGGVYGVWNPLAEEVIWKESYREGVCGVWDPVFETVIFKTFRNGCIVGWFDERERKVVWRRKERHGICVVLRSHNSEQPYISVCANFCGWR